MEIVSHPVPCSSLSLGSIQNLLLCLFPNPPARHEQDVVCLCTQDLEVLCCVQTLDQVTAGACVFGSSLWKSQG